VLKARGNNLSIGVADQGIGMDAAALGRLGEAFFQAQDGLNRSYEGTGLGLSIVKGLVELHGGSLHAVSEPGRGTTMTVLLPINGPATKPRDNVVITPLRPEPAPQPPVSWPDVRRNAR
jgi:cell cycle sensor histidine kinase DivJ